MDKKTGKQLIIFGVIAGVLLVGAMIYSLTSFKYDPSVAQNGDNDSISVGVDGEDDDVNTSAVQ